MQRIKNFFHGIFHRLVHLNDSPQRVAIGFGVGVFMGILPFTGPVAALVLAVILRVNRIAAFTGSLVTNTWFSVVTFVLAVKIGAGVVGKDWHDVKSACERLIKNFHWENIFDVGVFEILKPLFIGYAIIGSIAGFIGYLTALIVITQRRKYKQRHTT